MTILVTGGAGYIGSHTTVELLEQGYDVVIVDNFSNSSIDVIDRVERITNKKVTWYNINLLDMDSFRKVFELHNVFAVIHFAGFKAVGESVDLPLKYYRNNLISTLNLLELLDQFGVYNFIFSSSATVYGIPNKLPITEDSPLDTTNPYGKTKLMIEEMLMDLSKSSDKWKIVSLRYFNPVGAHPSGLIGESPNGVPNNLMPYITQVASGKLDKLYIFGADYSTKDGTGVRDYIHVVDLAKGHLNALEHIRSISSFEAFNLGTGQGYSVLEVIRTFEKATGVKIPYKVIERRHGDVPICYANSEKALKKFSWKAKKDLFEMCRDSWNWEKNRAQMSSILN